MTSEQKGGGSGDRQSTSINLDRFKKRLKILYSHWNKWKSDLWNSSHVISMVCPPETAAEHLKSTALSMWLLGHKLEDTIMVFMETEMHILCSTENASILEALQGPAKEAIGVDCLLYVKGNRADKEPVLRLMDGLMENISKGTHISIPIVGPVAREASCGWVARIWTEKLRSLNFPLHDVVAGFSDLFAVKDHGEIMNVRKAAYMTDNMMKHRIIPEIEDVVDEEDDATHSWLTEKAQKAVSEAVLMVDKNLLMNPNGVGICFGPIFQSGGGFDIRLGNGASSTGLLQYGDAGVAIIALGCSYNGYCSVMARMMLFNASPRQTKAYNVLVTAEEAVIGSLRPGVKLGAVYQAAVSAVEREAPELVPHLTETAGSSMGLEFLEPGWVIEARNERAVRQNMVFNVYLGFQDLQDGQSGCTFSMVLADTVVVGVEETEVVTQRCSKLPKDVSYSFTEEDEEDEDEDEDMHEEKPTTFDGKETRGVAVIGQDTHKMISGDLTLEQWLDLEFPRVPKGPRSSRRRQQPKVPKGPRSRRRRWLG